MNNLSILRQASKNAKKHKAGEDLTTTADIYLEPKKLLQEIPRQKVEEINREDCETGSNCSGKSTQSRTKSVFLRRKSRHTSSSIVMMILIVALSVYSILLTLILRSDHVSDNEAIMSLREKNQSLAQTNDKQLELMMEFLNLMETINYEDYIRIDPGAQMIELNGETFAKIKQTTN